MLATLIDLRDKFDTKITMITTKRTPIKNDMTFDIYLDDFLFVHFFLFQISNQMIFYQDQKLSYYLFAWHVANLDAV